MKLGFNVENLQKFSRSKKGSVDPSVFVGTYGKYNSDGAVGEWLNLNDYADYDEFMAAAHELHKDEADPELMFQDWEGIPEGMIGESHLDPQIWDWMELTENWDDKQEAAFKSFMENYYPGGMGGNDLSSLVEEFEERYHGTWRSMEDFAMNLVDDIGFDSLSNKEYYFDAEKFGRDLRYDGYYEVTEEDDEHDQTGVYDPEDQYTGYDTLTELAESYFDEGIIGKEQMESYFDWEKFAHDLEIGGDYYYDEKTGAVFSNN